jgi:hypothetical protein
MIDDEECEAVGGMRIGKGNRKSRRKPAPVPLCPLQIAHDLTWAGTRAAAVGGQRLFYLVCEAIGTVATPGLLYQPGVKVMMIVEEQMECRLEGETELLGENLPQRHFCPSQNYT